MGESKRRESLFELFRQLGIRQQRSFEGVRSKDKRAYAALHPHLAASKTS